MQGYNPTPEQMLALAALAEKIQLWARELGFQQIGISDGNLSSEAERLEEWLDEGYNGTMAWMAERQEMRKQPEKLHEGTRCIISARMDYLPDSTEQIKILKSPEKAYISRYALGRDYHKLIRKRLAKVAEKINAEACIIFPDQPAHQRPFVDSAPVLERPLAEKAGLGWVGKHTLLINQYAGSWFFLGEIFTDLPFPTNTFTAENKCGDCEACLKVCPTAAFPKPYQLDARRCIAYLTIENKGPIPQEYRAVMGNRVFGCDDCQAICPWNKYAQPSGEKDFQPRHGLANSDLLTLFLWNEDTFLKNTEGSAIRRIGFEGWQRNLAIGLGNAPHSNEIIQALRSQKNTASTLVAEHIDWALAQQLNPQRKRPRKLQR
ncbi:tRNA epoxyqueuosine(34) reductase QueG [Teredinibacter purpureus]|uniref:tRNA epoxyqueuosine(34) reductase QueG n=1 Tax=Teredinibacter purpureus TaxID=2731756 RepID=UPI0005F82AB4|nr:tRNA epoxyqueuosine(34) reductase QueG [Teredinibacter purpureus]